MKLYSVSDGPPSLSVRMALKALKIPFDLIEVDFIKSEHMTDDYAKVNDLYIYIFCLFFYRFFSSPKNR